MTIRVWQGPASGCSACLWVAEEMLFCNTMMLRPSDPLALSAGTPARLVLAALLLALLWAAVFWARAA